MHISFFINEGENTSEAQGKNTNDIIMLKRKIYYDTCD